MTQAKHSADPTYSFPSFPHHLYHDRLFACWLKSSVKRLVRGSKRLDTASVPATRVCTHCDSQLLDHPWTEPGRGHNRGTRRKILLYSSSRSLSDIWNSSLRGKLEGHCSGPLATLSTGSVGDSGLVHLSGLPLPFLSSLSKK